MATWCVRIWFLHVQSLLLLVNISWLISLKYSTLHTKTLDTL